MLNNLSDFSVLLVEDEDTTRIIIENIITNKVNKVFTAKDGQEGLKIFNKKRPDIVITDMKMPIMNGLDMIKEIRKIDEDCGIIINTEVKDVDLILTSFDIGIDKYIVKPIDINKINEALNVISKKTCKNNNNYKKEYILSLTKEEKKKVEDEIKSKFSAFYKQNIGKGPKYIHILFESNKVKIKAFDVLTHYEKSILNLEVNNPLVEYNRNLFYRNNKKYLESILTEILNISVELNNYGMDLLENVDELNFSCK